MLKNFNFSSIEVGMFSSIFLDIKDSFPVLWDIRIRFINLRPGSYTKIFSNFGLKTKFLVFSFVRIVSTDYYQIK